MWVVKLDSLGLIQWQNTIGGTNEDALYSIFQTIDGGYICGGFSPSNISGDKTENSLGQSDYWMIKLDSSGSIQWQNTIGGIYGEVLYSIAKTADEGIVCGGYSGSNFSGDKMENSLGQSDYWVLRLTDKYNSITGKLFIDANSNQIQDAGEPAVSNKQITEANAGRFSFSQQNGNYSVSVLDSGNFTVLANGLNYYTTVPTMHTAYFSGIQQTDSLNDFAF